LFERIDLKKKTNAISCLKKIHWVFSRRQQARRRFARGRSRRLGHAQRARALKVFHTEKTHDSTREGKGDMALRGPAEVEPPQVARTRLERTQRQVRLVVAMSTNLNKKARCFI
jgi:hypothetical protein